MNAGDVRCVACNYAMNSFNWDGPALTQRAGLFSFGSSRPSLSGVAYVSSPTDYHDDDAFRAQLADRASHGHPRHPVGVGHVLVRRQPSTTRKPPGRDVRAQILRNLPPHQGRPVMVDTVPPVSQHAWSIP